MNKTLKDALMTMLVVISIILFIGLISFCMITGTHLIRIYDNYLNQYSGLNEKNVGEIRSI